MTITVFLAGGKATGTKSFVSDAVISVAPTFRNTITEHPIESKSSISDHVFKQNVLLSIKGVVSNYPIQEYADNLIEYDGNRVKTAYNLLKELWASKQLFTVVAEHDVYRNCILAGFTTDFTYKTSDSLEYSLEIEQVRFVDTEEIEGVVINPDVVGDKATTSAGSAATRNAKKAEAGVIPNTVRTLDRVPEIEAAREEQLNAIDEEKIQ